MDSEVVSDDAEISDEDRARIEREKEVIAMEEEQAANILEEKTEGGGCSDSSSDSDNSSDSDCDEQDGGEYKDSMVGGMDPPSEATKSEVIKPKKKRVMGVLPLAAPLAEQAPLAAPLVAPLEAPLAAPLEAPLAPPAPSATVDYQRHHRLPIERKAEA